eukprot:Sspe_Gene.22995::Locus_8854_Transcript_2_4_Confidence_0.667_Length_584::g.22995::m.22995
MWMLRTPHQSPAVLLLRTVHQRGVQKGRRCHRPHHLHHLLRQPVPLHPNEVGVLCGVTLQSCFKEAPDPYDCWSKGTACQQWFLALIRLPLSPTPFVTSI